MNSKKSPSPGSIPMDIRLGMTKSENVAYPLRWGIIGAGKISRQWVLSLRACKGATVTAVAARSEDRAKEFASRYGIKSAYGSYAEMVASAEVDIVYIGTITRLHKEHSLLAINAGKHVLCEKPLAENIEDARAMYAAAAAKKVMLQDGVWTRFFPAVEHARAAIEATTIGETVMVLSTFFDPFYTIQAAPLGFGAGAKPTFLTVAGGKASGAIVAYGDSRCAVLAFPPFKSEQLEVTEIIGTAGRITLEPPGHCPTGISIRVPDQVPSLYMTANMPAPVQHFEYPLPTAVGIPLAYPNQHGFLYQAEAVHRCLAAGLLQCPQYNREESLNVMDLWTQFNEARRALTRY
jgi:dihydrodiol dehydrogenase / D-xylose 1-dehydrogenase (NADP)